MATPPPVWAEQVGAAVTGTKVVTWRPQRGHSQSIGRRGGRPLLPLVAGQPVGRREEVVLVVRRVLMLFQRYRSSERFASHSQALLRVTPTG